jgi:exonuclease SbcC
MRPLNLKVKGFTAFREEQELDFRHLDNIFAITGSTGAGKSSILDAITYALYGEVERVHRECAQLVSHGLPRMAVTLDFEVNGAEYRIARTTPARGGATKVGLERIVDGTAQSYGEGADRVRDVSDMVTHLIGLDYNGFTRSVLLPQGKFAQFMTGAPDERRAILTDLLGLGLFKRMAQRAGRTASESQSEAGIKRGLLDTEYQGVSKESLAEARGQAKLARARGKALGVASKIVDGLAKRWREAQSRASELGSCVTELREWGQRVAKAAATVDGLLPELGKAESGAREWTGNATKAEGEAGKAKKALEDAEAAWGSAIALAGAQTTAQGLAELRNELAVRQATVDEIDKRQPSRRAVLQGHVDSLASAKEALGKLEIKLEQTRQQLKEVEHADLAATLSAGLEKGDPCPVCGEPLERLPQRTAASALKAAVNAVRADEKPVDLAKKHVIECERQIERAERDIEQDGGDATRVRAEIEKTRKDLATAEQTVIGALRGPLSKDPVAILGERIKKLAFLAEAERSTSQAYGDAARKLDGFAQSHALLLQKIVHARTQIEEEAPNLLARLARAAAEEYAAPQIPSVAPGDVAPKELVIIGRTKAAGLEEVAANVQSLAKRTAENEPILLEQAGVAVGELVPQAGSLAELVDDLKKAQIDAAEKRATAERDVEVLGQRLESRDRLVEEVAALKERASQFQALATDLRADRLVAFLQDEALNTLATAASVHLRNLSDGRYELRCRRDFFVVDTWNGDEERSVRTLSGGETFLASLALALSLAEQVRALSVTERARLDSLFLDEGFGTLDSESLHTAVEAIERLGGDGRLVGVITHVREVAEQFPRIEVEKTPRGSRLRFAS